jgi:hypothetical protein
METTLKSLTGALKRIGRAELILMLIAGAISWIGGWASPAGFTATLVFLNFYLLTSLIADEWDYREPQYRYPR